MVLEGGDRGAERGGQGVGQGSLGGLLGMGSAARLSAPRALVLWAALGAAAHIGPAPDPEDWWSYKDNLHGNFVPGPPFWGLVNAAWSLCAVGKRQSPVDVELKRVLYDPFLPPLRLSTGGEKLRGTLYNTGRHVSFLPAPRPVVNVSGGPLLYSHRLSELRLLFGARDGAGSEHQINHQGFSAEVQLIHFNQELYGNFSAASRGPNGLAILSLFVNVSGVEIRREGGAGRLLNRDTITRISYKNDAYFLQDLSLELLFPESFGFITYQGSLSTPPCSETVTWILIDRALNITSLQMHSLRLLSQNPPSQIFQSLSGNGRPLQPLAHRALRGNRDPRHPERRCRGPNYRLHDGTVYTPHEDLQVVQPKTESGCPDFPLLLPSCGSTQCFSTRYIPVPRWQTPDGGALRGPAHAPCSVHPKVTPPAVVICLTVDGALHGR
ncbi:Carbonic anhydrase- protein 11 [Saguinus oedipus]|uniref:Carbonic anhydrase-related protein 11 n=1 Tax=Saguinus oedipus TaxID=9490 RepID=A0ABQ9TVN4_SAGOE|nr:Carbonic anhydrase- protein 11 [Saguinus oedipus]